MLYSEHRDPLISTFVFQSITNSDEKRRQLIWYGVIKKNIIRTKDPDTSHNYTLEIRGMYIPI
jgi:hypothetical protein